MPRFKSAPALLLTASIIAAPVALATPAFAAETTTTTTTYSVPTGLNTGAISKTTIGLSWQPVAGAPNYRIQYSKSADMSNSTYVRWSTPSVDIRNLESNTTYYFKVRVISADGNTSLSGYSSAVSAKTNIAPVLGAVSNPLKVSSFNIKCDNCFDTGATSDQLHWEDRRDTIVAQVKSKAPDVIGFQEASQAMLKEPGDRYKMSQFDDLQQAFTAAGTSYQITNDHRYNCENHLDYSQPCAYKDQGASQGSKIFYNASTLSLVDEGSVKLPEVDSEAGAAQNERYAAWAILRQNSSGKTFFFVDTHLDFKQDTLEFQALKAKEAQRIVDLVKEKNKANLPVFIVGDMNANKYTSFGNVPYDTFLNNGFIEPLGNDYQSTYPSGKAVVEKRINAEYNSFNAFDRHLDKNTAVGANGKHIDYIYSTPMRVAEWEMVLNKDANDDWVGIIPSDHNMITETVELPASVSPLAAKVTQLNGSLGKVTGSEVYSKTGGYQRYENGYVLWSPATGAQVSSGAIRTGFAASGYESGPLGYPKAAEVTGQLNGGSYQMYENGAINWSPATGAHATYGEIRAKWAATGYQNGSLGYPTSDVVSSPNGGTSQRFERGAIISSPATGTRVTSLDIYDAWLRTDSKATVLGYPTGDVVTTEKGTYQRFENGYIDWTATTGAYGTYGEIRSRWAATGYGDGILGYPIADVKNGTVRGGSYQHYQNGWIAFSPASGAHTSVGPIRNVWAGLGYQDGALGYPTSDVYNTSTGTAQDYEGGKISRTTAGVNTVTYK